MKVLIFSHGDLLNALKDGFKNNSNFNVIGVTCSIEELIKMVGDQGRVVVVMDLTTTEEMFTDVVAVAKSKDIRIIAVCKDVRRGFTFLKNGAQDMVVAPFKRTPQDMKSFAQNLVSKVGKVFKEYDTNTKSLKHNFDKKVVNIIAIGSSTGGTEIILKILKKLPKDTPPILIVQHMPAVFTKMYAKRLNAQCPMSVWEADDGDKLENGLALVAPGEMHMRLQMKNGKYTVTCKREASVGGHVPSVDVLFNSIADFTNRNAIGVILTGMGSDGASGLLRMRQKGAYTIGQDEKSSVVYGMPKVAHSMGAVVVQAPPDEIPQLIMDRVSSFKAV
ncbi:MAG: CheB methylesterase domain-containing protein [Defluviitaleaceae bacterium]|nr:CheB methylesterase domain-containing protein [Defluviitaleaceae bacterium]